MPKLVLNSAGDQFFLPDSTQFYWKDLKGPKYLRYVPNTDHSMKNSDALQSLVSFHDAILRKKALPEYSWELPSPGAENGPIMAAPRKAERDRAQTDFEVQRSGKLSCKPSGSGRGGARQLLANTRRHRRRHTDFRLW